MGKTRLEDCPTCKAKKSIEITTSEVTDDGFTIQYKKCTSCGNLHKYNSEYKLVKYEHVI